MIETIDQNPVDKRFLAFAIIVLLGLFIYLSCIPYDTSAQLRLASSLILLLALMRFVPPHPLIHLLFLCLASFITIRYLCWRLTDSIHWHGPLSFAFAGALFLAEIYGIIIFLLGVFTNLSPIRRSPRALQGPPETWPSVDVLIPTYNESRDLLEVTLIAATQLRYPRHLLKVHLCDDGGTTQRTTHPDPDLARAAHERQMSLRALCAELGATYLTRERNVSSKAGNLNEVLRSVSGDLVLVLDADHIPTVDFLEKTVGFLQADEKTFLVQTPHFFINPDPIEKNLDIFGRIPSENEMFFGIIQQGLDFWNASLFCGSAAILRRSCLSEVGGLSGITVTEDAETSLKLHAKGYRSIYLSHPLISGLQPETYSGFVVQRVRWAQGMVQLLLLKNPLLQKGLSLPQRLSYFSKTFYWFFGFARITFLVAPAAFLIFGLKIYDATVEDYVAYAIPFVLANILVTDFLYGKVRWNFISEVYELLQALYSFPGVMRVFMRPHDPTFAVTPKGELSSEDFVSDLSGPFYLLYLLTLVAMGAGIWRWFSLPGDRTITLITMGWELMNLLLLNAANGVLYERRQRRSNPRMPADLPAELHFPGRDPIACVLRDLSVGGAFIEVGETALEGVLPAETAVLGVQSPALETPARIRVALQNRRSMPGGKAGLGIQFAEESIESKRIIVALAHGDSDRWKGYQEKIQRSPGIFKAFLFLVWLGTKHNGTQLRALTSDAFIRLLKLPLALHSRIRPRLNKTAEPAIR